MKTDDTSTDNQDPIEQARRDVIEKTETWKTPGAKSADTDDKREDESADPIERAMARFKRRTEDAWKGAR